MVLTGLSDLLSIYRRNLCLSEKLSVFLNEKPFFHVLHILQTSFKALSSMWSRLLDEAELLNFLHNISVNLRPFVASQASVGSEAGLDSLQGAAEVKSDDQRLAESSGMSDRLPTCSLVSQNSAQRVS